MKIGIDIDGTIKNTHKAAVEVFNREFSKNISVEDVSDFYLDKAYGLSKEEGKRIWRKLEEEIYQLGLPLEHAPEVLNDLVRKGHVPFFITARPDTGNIRQITIQWLLRHSFPYTGDNLVMDSRDKAAIAKKLGVELFFEDAPDHLANLLANGVNTVIVDAPYNRHFPDTVARITDWRQVYRFIK